MNGGSQGAPKRPGNEAGPLDSRPPRDPITPASLTSAQRRAVETLLRLGAAVEARKADATLQLTYTDALAGAR